MRPLLFSTVLLLLVACEHSLPQKETEITLSGDIFSLKVVQMRVVEDYTSPRKLPSVEHLFPISPADMVKTWVKTRLSANGASNTMEIVISDASVIKKDLPKTKQGVEGLLTKEQAEQYDGTLDVYLKIYNEIKPLPIASVHATTHRTLTLPEGASVADRQALYHQMTKDLIDGLNKELESNIRRYFGQYLL